MPITRIHPNSRKLKIVGGTHLNFTNRPPHEKQYELTNQKENALVSKALPFWKRWLAFLKNNFS